MDNKATGNKQKQDYPWIDMKKGTTEAYFGYIHKTDNNESKQYSFWLESLGKKATSHQLTPCYPPLKMVASRCYDLEIGHF